MRQDLELLQGACDIHIHSSPDVFVRLYDHIDVAKQARDAGMRAVLMKCHHQGTADRMPLVHLILVRTYSPRRVAGRPPRRSSSTPARSSMKAVVLLTSRSSKLLKLMSLTWKPTLEVML